MQIWAVATTLLRDVGRRGGFRLFVVALAAVAALLPRGAPGDDLADQLRLAVSYGLGLPSVLIGIATLVFASGALCEEIARRYAVLVTTKPIARWKILLGKWLGVALLDAGLLALVSVVFAIHVAILLSADFPQAQRERARDRFLSPRIGVRPAPQPVPDGALEKLVERWLLEGRSAGEAQEQARRTLQIRRLAPGERAVLAFAGLPPGARSGEKLQVRCRLFVSPPQPEVELLTSWRFAASGGAIEKDLVVGNSRLHVIDVDAGIVGRDGRLEIILGNEEAPRSNINFIVDPDHIEVLHAHSSFAASLGRALLLLLSQLLFLAALGILASSMFTLPTANLLAFSVYLTGVVSGFLEDSLEALDFEPEGGSLGAMAGRLLVEILRGVIRLLPDFAAESPLARVTDGRALIAAEWGASIAWILGARCGLLLLAAAFFWSRRELGGTRS